jgi:hypothetical protein
MLALVIGGRSRCEIPLQYMIKLCSILGSLDRAHEGRNYYIGYSSMYIFDVDVDM